MKPNELTEKEIKKLQKKFPQIKKRIPKKRLTKEDIETIQGYVEMIEEENQELELELSGYRKAILNNKEMLGLKEQNQELRKQLEVSNELVAQGTLTEMKLRDENNRLRKEYQETYKDVRIEIKEYKTQQKEFIEYMTKTIEELECEDVDDEEMKGYLIQRIDIYKEILSKFKKIIGSDINVGSIGDKE